MAVHLLDGFAFTTKSAHHPEDDILHVLGEFVADSSIETRDHGDRPIPMACRYSFSRLQDAMKKDLGDIDGGFQFIVPVGRSNDKHFTVTDDCSFADFVQSVKLNVDNGKLDVLSSNFEARLILAEKALSEAGVTTPSADEQMAEVELTVQSTGADEENDDSGDMVERVREVILIPDDDDDEDENKDDDDATERDGLLGYLRDRNLIEGPKVAALAWTFNIANAKEINLDTTWKVPGMTKPATIVQCAFVYDLGRRLRHDGDLQGIYNADGVGVGKTFTTLMLVVLRRLASLTLQHVGDHPEQHFAKNKDRSIEEGGRCAFTQLIGIQCVCEKNSVLKVLLDRIPESYTVITVPRTIESVWTSHFADCILPQFGGEAFPFSNQPVLCAYHWDERQNFVPIGSSPILNLATFLVIPTLRRTTKSKPIRVTSGRSEDGWTMDRLDEVRQRDDDTDAVTFERHPDFGDVHRRSVIIMSRERLSTYCSPTANNPCRPVEVWVKPSGSPTRDVKVSRIFPFDLAILVCDEFHRYKGAHNNVSNALRAYWQRKERLRQPSPFAVFLSATPAVAKLGDLRSASSIVNRNGEKHMEVVAALENADKNASDRGSRDYRASMDTVYKAVEDWMISRAGNTPMLGGGKRIRVTHPPPEVIVRTFDTPEAIQRSMEETIDGVRREIKQKHKSVRPNAIELSSIKGTDLMLKVGPVPGLHLCVEADSNFPYSGGLVEKDVQAYDDGVRREQSAYLNRIDLLTGGDDMFSDMAHIVREASQGKVAYRPNHEASPDPLHIVLFTCHPCNAAASYVYLKENCSRVAEVVCLLSDSLPAAREAKLTELLRLSRGRRVDAGGKSIVVITTFKLGGFGSNSLVFCSMMIQLGEPQTQAELIQADGRIARQGQEKEKTFRFYMKREGSESESLLRIRNGNRVAVCGDELSRMRLFQGVELDLS